jgi:hypothetical protein
VACKVPVDEAILSKVILLEPVECRLLLMMFMLSVEAVPAKILPGGILQELLYSQI